MDMWGCGVCGAPGQHRPATYDEARSFWRAKGIDGAAPPGLDVHSLIRCWAPMDLPNRSRCECETAWVRNAADEKWRAIVRLPSDFVASVSG